MAAVGDPGINAPAASAPRCPHAVCHVSVATVRMTCFDKKLIACMGCGLELDDANLSKTVTAKVNLAPNPTDARLINSRPSVPSALEADANHRDEPSY